MTWPPRGLSRDLAYLLLLAAIAAAFRLPRLGYPSVEVFDEVYHAKTALQYLRKKKRSREELMATTDDAPVFEPSCAAPSPEMVVANRQLAERARGVIENLDDTYRSVFDLRVEDHTETEIAARLGISVANVKIRAHRTRRKVRDTLRDLYAIDDELALSA